MKDCYMTEELIEQVKKLIIDSLRIEGMSPEEIDTDAPLFGEGLVPDAATGTKVFASVRSMADYIAEHRK
jgi:acyl carrier protein